MSDEPSVATAKLLAHSVHGDYPDCDLYTVEATFARSALAELNTHRVFSRNSASSRAIPVKKMLDQVENNPFIPRRFSIAQKGMSADEFVEPGDGMWDECLDWWLDSRDVAVDQAEKGLELGLHKQDVNRILEPFLMHTAIISSTEWYNFVDLRTATNPETGAPLAYPPIFDLAIAIADAIDEDEAERSATLHMVKPWTESVQWWHLPLVQEEEDDLPMDTQMKISAARCARVSYLTHDGVRNVEADLALFERLLAGNHLSPFEHVAHPHDVGSGNFKMWRQLRYYIENGDFA